MAIAILIELPNVIQNSSLRGYEFNSFFILGIYDFLLINLKSFDSI